MSPVRDMSVQKAIPFCLKYLLIEISVNIIEIEWQKKLSTLSPKKKVIQISETNLEQKYFVKTLVVILPVVGVFSIFRFMFSLHQTS